MAVARRMRTGQVAVNGGRFNVRAPFGGYRLSGVGRELGEHGLAEYFELTSLQLPEFLLLWLPPPSSWVQWAAE